MKTLRGFLEPAPLIRVVPPPVETNETNDGADLSTTVRSNSKYLTVSPNKCYGHQVQVQCWRGGMAWHQPSCNIKGQMCTQERVETLMDGRQRGSENISHNN
jgi:hypothetical protein